jgi:small ligand-binding sensory domain FIST
MKVGTGYGNEACGFTNGRAVAKTAVESGDISRPDIVLAFCGGAVDGDDFFRGLRDVLGDSTPIIGGSAVGVITKSHLSYEGHPAAAAVIESDAIRWNIASAGALNQGERQAGETLGKRLPDDPDARALLLLYDSLKVPATPATPPVLNASLPLIEGVEGVRRRAVPIFGGGLIGDLAFSTSRQFCGDHVGRQEVVGALLSGGVEIHSRIMHGCTPYDGVYHTVTRADGDRIYDVDGKPVVELLDEIYGNREWRTQIPVRRLTIGVNKGEKFGDFKEGDFVNRLIAGVLPNGDGVVLFEPDLKEGTEILFMLRDAEEMIRSARVNTGELFSELIRSGRHPLLGLYIDCAGRVASYSWTRTEEGSEIISIFNQYDTPLLGFFSGVEVAPFWGVSRGLDWTGVLMMLTE